MQNVVENSESSDDNRPLSIFKQTAVSSGKTGEEVKRYETYIAQRGAHLKTVQKSQKEKKQRKKRQRRNSPRCHQKPNMQTHKLLKGKSWKWPTKASV